MEKPQKNPGIKPPGMICYICGQEYGSNSVMIHIKACEKKWKAMQDILPIEERRKCPKPSQEFITYFNPKNQAPVFIGAKKEPDYNPFKETALILCDNCQRSFKPLVYKSHSEVCVPDKVFNKIHSKKGLKKKAHDIDEYEEPKSKVNENKKGAIPMKGLPSKIPERVKIFEIKSNNIKIGNVGKKIPIVVDQHTDSDSVLIRPRNESANVVVAESTKQVSQKLPESSKKVGKVVKPEPKKVVKPSEKKQDTGPKPVTLIKNLGIKPDNGGFATQLEKRPKEAKKIEKPSKVFEKGMPDLDLIPCAKCSRKFVSDRIAKHQKACKVNSKPKKVKVFHKPLTEADKKKMGKYKTSKWKQQHQELIEQMAYIKKMKILEKKGGKIQDMPPPPKSKNENYLVCPHCARKFNPESHEKHVKICKNVVNKPKPVPKIQPQSYNQTDIKPSKIIRAPNGGGVK